MRHWMDGIAYDILYNLSNGVVSQTNKIYPTDPQMANRSDNKLEYILYGIVECIPHHWQPNLRRCAGCIYQPWQ